jgi:hypothetical protein
MLGNTLVQKVQGCRVRDRGSHDPRQACAAVLDPLDLQDLLPLIDCI